MSKKPPKSVIVQIILSVNLLNVNKNCKLRYVEQKIAFVYVAIN